MTPEQQKALAMARARMRAAQDKGTQSAPTTSAAEQLGAGTTEGLASIFGLPSDLADASTDMITRGINRAFGTELKTSDSLPGGPRLGTSERYVQDAQTAGVMPTEGPQTTGQRYARRIGQEAGAMAVPGGLAASATARPAAALAMEGASAVGAGVGGQTAAEVAPDNVFAQLIATMVGGGAPIAASRAARPGPQAPSMDDLRARQGAAYSALDNSQATVTPAARQRLIDDVGTQMSDQNMDQYLHPRATRTTQRMDDLPAAPRILDIEQKRRLAGRDVAGSVDPAERELGVSMKNTFDQYLAGLQPSDMQGSDAPEAIAALGTGREMTRRIKGAELIDELVDKGTRRAATSGTGGNEVNAIRQNIRSILDDPKKRRRFKPAEIEAMEQIVRGDATTNTLRMVGRMSPTSGALPLMASVGAPPLMGPLGVAIPATGMVAKGGAEMLTKRQVDRLSALVRNGAPLDPKRMSQPERSALAALLAAHISGSPIDEQAGP